MGCSARPLPTCPLPNCTYDSIKWLVQHKNCHCSFKVEGRLRQGRPWVQPSTGSSRWDHTQNHLHKCNSSPQKLCPSTCNSVYMYLSPKTPVCINPKCPFVTRKVCCNAAAWDPRASILMTPRGKSACLKIGHWSTQDPVSPSVAEVVDFKALAWLSCLSPTKNWLCFLRLDSLWWVFVESIARSVSMGSMHVAMVSLNEVTSLYCRDTMRRSHFVAAVCAVMSMAPQLLSAQSTSDALGTPGKHSRGQTETNPTNMLLIS